MHNKKNKKKYTLIKSKEYLELINTAIGLIIFIFSILLTLSFISFYINFNVNNDRILFNSDINGPNLVGHVGFFLGKFFIYFGIGISAFIVPFLLLLLSIKILLNKKIIKIWIHIYHSLFILIWITIFFGYFTTKNYILSGLYGFLISKYLIEKIGDIGFISILFLSLIIYIIFEFKITTKKINIYINKKKKNIKNKLNIYKKLYKNLIVKNKIINSNIHMIPYNKERKYINKSIIDLKKSITFDEKKSDIYQYPYLNLIKKKYNNLVSINIDTNEIYNNKNKILKTLKIYGIDIKYIKETIGPTVTLYEIIPHTGVRIAKIKNLKNEIALALSALSIRFIIPIPGKGTIGIEIANSNSSIVPIYSVLSSIQFQNIKMELPIILGKTIFNETFVKDLSKMPHLLLSGATGQGKSVGINSIIISLLYKKHPSELKFVLIDPKKIELNIYNNINAHFLAKIPNNKNSIITNHKDALNTLNALCLEMDYRYDLLNHGLVRNIQEYNKKILNKTLSSKKRHHFLPYIIVIIDEFADLIIKTEKSIETPITRLAQLSRAVGIHLIIATQRPSVNVITGNIKANFSTRIAFRVSSKVDSRTILDINGAEELIGKGDMLFSENGNIIRIQSPFLDIEDIEKITKFISNQKSNSTYLLPCFNEINNINNCNKDKYNI